MVKIGNIQLDIPVFQAALSGYSDLAMRQLARQFGAPMTFSGLMLDKTAVHQKAWQKGAFILGENEQPIGGQLLGNEPQMMARAAEIMAGKGYDLIDLNLACPAPKVIARHRGGYLLREPQRAIEIVRAIRNAVSLPLTIKLRTSFYLCDQDKEDFWRICEGAIHEGVNGIFVHGRAVEQRYRGRADWDIIRAVKQRFPETTVFGSGDLFTAEDAVARLNESEVDGVIIARGAIGNPWLFRDLREVLTGVQASRPPRLTEVGQVMERHFDMLLELYEHRKVVAYFRKFCAGYCRRHPRRKQALLALMAAKTVRQVHDAIQEWFSIVRPL